MNIYDFFNSTDVAEYCQSISHTFNAMESAVMVSQSETRSLAEKLAAYREIIAEYPDMEVPEGNNHGHIKSFHEALGQIIAYEERKLEKYLAKEEGAVYRAQLKDKNCPDVFDEYEWCTYSNFESTLGALADRVKKYEESLGEEPGERYYFAVRKTYVDSAKWIQAETLLSGDIRKVDYSGIAEFEPDEAFYHSCYYLLETYIDVPVPFKRGDLVETDGIGYMGNTFVLQNICRDNAEWHERHLLCADLMDMTANVFYESEGTVYCDCVHFYPDLRYCRRELTEETRILKYVSLFVREKLCLCGLLKLQKYLVLHKKADELVDCDLKYQLDTLGDKLLQTDDEIEG